MMDTADRLAVRLAAASHAVQIAFCNHMEQNSEDQGNELNVLSLCTRKPADLLPDHTHGYKEGLALWSDQEVIEILTDAAKVDQIIDRPLGRWEMMRLEQRDMIRRALASKA